MDVRIEIGATPGPRRFMGLLPGRKQPVKIPRDRQILVLGLPESGAEQLVDYLRDHEVEVEHRSTWDSAIVHAADILIVGAVEEAKAADAAAYLKMAPDEFASLVATQFVLRAGAYQSAFALSPVVRNYQRVATV
ncbi:hypothetical protein [Burkholderia cepacia]|uniref:hypothetical protein n=1 Tax=Burkholderia cepacia TaxID=292 RepID=UPI002AB6F353|nr:hypothetical protein [Burkholderia cepacia]